METKMTNEMVNAVINAEYVLLEDKICYDWDDYGVWGAVLFDIANKKIVTAQYGHGVDLSVRDKSIRLKDAINANLVNVAEMIDVMRNALGISFNKADIDIVAACHSIEKPLDIPVKIVRGRKGKGINGRLVYAIREPERYGLGAYRGWYNYRPVVMNLETNELIYPNSMAYLEYDEDFIKRFNEEIEKNIEATTNEVNSLAHAWAYGMSYSACDSENFRNLVMTYSNRGISAGEKISDELKVAIDAYKEEENRKREEKKAQEMPKIIEWVKANTDKEGDAIIELAERIFNKYN